MVNRLYELIMAMDLKEIENLIKEAEVKKESIIKLVVDNDKKPKK